MPEDVITAFAVSVLCERDDLIRRELNAHNVTTKAQLLRILSGISVKQRLDSNDEVNKPMERITMTNPPTRVIRVQASMQEATP